MEAGGGDVYYIGWMRLNFWALSRPCIVYTAQIGQKTHSVISVTVCYVSLLLFNMLY